MNWSTPQTVTVTGVDDAAVDGSVAYSVTNGAASSSDILYNGVAVPDVSLHNWGIPQLAYVKASNTDASDYFGASIALSSTETRWRSPPCGSPALRRESAEHRRTTPR